MSAPAHKSEKQFRRYEDTIFKMVQEPTRVHTIFPAPLSPTTVSCRFRDAVNSLLEYQWPSPIDTAELARIWPNIEVGFTADGAGVEIRPKGSAKTFRPIGQVSSTDVAGPTKVLGETASLNRFVACISNPSKQDLYALAYLLDKKILTSPVKLIGADPHLLNQIAGEYDVAFSQEDNYVIML